MRRALWLIGVLCTIGLIVFATTGAPAVTVATRAAPVEMTPGWDRRSLSDAEERKATPPRPVARSVGLAQTCAAAAPVLIAPVGGAVSRDLDNPRYTFGTVAGIREYIFQIATANTFSDPLDTDNEFTTPGVTEETFTSFFDLTPNRAYYWRMASVCDDGSIGAFSAPATFNTGDRVTGATCGLAPPTPQAPINGATVATLVPNITWVNSAGAVELRYQLARDPAFTQIEDSVRFLDINADPTTVVTEQPSDNLRPNTTYYWRVASVCAEIDTDGAFGGPVSFTVGNVTGPFPAPPAQIAPADNATAGSIRVNVLLEASAGADSYAISYYRSRASAENDSASLTQYRSAPQSVVVFNPNETWYWRARARNSLGWGEPGAIRVFRTPIDRASTTIDPQTGGTLAPDPGFLRATFPPGAVTSPTTVDFRLLSGPSQRLPNFRFANRAFTIEASAGGSPVTDFAQPFTLTITYDDSDLQAAGISDPTQMNLVFWNGSAWEPILPCSGCAIDPATRTVTVVIDHLTEFALVAPAPEVDVQLFLPLVRR